MDFFTADLHGGHANIIKFCGRPFDNVKEMDEALIANWNARVSDKDTVYHLGDFCFGDPQRYIERLKGTIVFVKGSHDRELEKAGLAKHEILDLSFQVAGRPQSIVLCHYCLRVWPKSHYGAWHLYGHSHGRLEPEGKSWDAGVDVNGFRPLSLDEVVAIMATRPDNFNLIRESRTR